MTGVLSAAILRSWRNLVSRSLLAALFVTFSPYSLRCQSGPSGAITLRVIVVSSEAEAAQIFDRLRQGEDFGVLAKSKSIDQYEEDYGYLGTVRVATLRPELQAVLKGLAPGKVTSAITVPGGFAILKVLPNTEGSIQQSMGANRNRSSSGKGTVLYPTDGAGQVIADLAFQRFPKPTGWEQDLSAVCEIRNQSLSTLESRLKDRLSHATPEQSPVDLIQAHYALAQIEAYQGHMQPALAEWEEAYQIAEAKVPTGVPQLE